MRTVLMISFIVFSTIVFAESLPKDCFGNYAGEMMAYSVVKNDVELNIERHDVFIKISSQDILYKSGTIQLKGSYTFLKQSVSEYLIKATLSNGKSVSYQMDLLWNKKARSLFLAGKNGEPDLVMVKLEQ